MGDVWVAASILSGLVDQLAEGCTCWGQRKLKWPHCPHREHGLCKHSHATCPHPKVWHVGLDMFYASGRVEGERTLKGCRSCGSLGIQVAAVTECSGVRGRALKYRNKQLHSMNKQTFSLFHFSLSAYVKKSQPPLTHDNAKAEQTRKWGEDNAKSTRRKRKTVKAHEGGQANTLQPEERKPDPREGERPTPISKPLHRSWLPPR